MPNTSSVRVRAKLSSRATDDLDPKEASRRITDLVYDGIRPRCPPGNSSEVEPDANDFPAPSDRTSKTVANQRKRCDMTTAEEVGFEPTDPCRSHDFQSCRFGRSRTPPK